MQWAYISFVGCHKLKIGSWNGYILIFDLSLFQSPGISAHVTWRVVGNQATHVVAYAPPTASLRGRAPPAAAVPSRQNVTVPLSVISANVINITFPIISRH